MEKSIWTTRDLTEALTHTALETSFSRIGDNQVMDFDTLGKIFFQQAQINIKNSEKPVPNTRVEENTHTLEPPNLVQRPDINPISQYIENGAPTLRVLVAPTLASNI